MSSKVITARSSDMLSVTRLPTSWLAAIARRTYPSAAGRSPARARSWAAPSSEKVICGPMGTESNISAASSKAGASAASLSTENHARPELPGRARARHRRLYGLRPLPEREMDEGFDREEVHVISLGAHGIESGMSLRQDRQRRGFTQSEEAPSPAPNNRARARHRKDLGTRDAECLAGQDGGGRVDPGCCRASPPCLAMTIDRSRSVEVRARSRSKPRPAADVPTGLEATDGSDQSARRCRHRPGSGRPAPSRAWHQVVELGRDPLPPDLLLEAVLPRHVALTQRHEELRRADDATDVCLTGIVKLFPCECPQRLEKTEPGATFIGRISQEHRLVDETRQAVDDVPPTDLAVGRHGLGGLGVEALTNTPRRSKTHCSVGEHRVRPLTVARKVWCRSTRSRRPPVRRRNRFVEGSDLGRRHRRHPGCGQLDGQRHAVEALADLGDRWPGFDPPSEKPGRTASARSCEESHRRSCRTRPWRPRPAGPATARATRCSPAMPRALPTGGEDPRGHPGTALQQGADGQPTPPRSKRCSQLSRTTSTVRSAAGTPRCCSAIERPRHGDWLGAGTASPTVWNITLARRWRRLASHSQTPFEEVRGSNSAATCSASRVLPTPPTPVRVTRRWSASMPTSAVNSRSRPMNDVSCTGRFPGKASSERRGANSRSRPGPRTWKIRSAWARSRSRCSPRSTSSTPAGRSPRTSGSVVPDRTIWPPWATAIRRAHRLSGWLRYCPSTTTPSPVCTPIRARRAPNDSAQVSAVRSRCASTAAATASPADANATAMPT